MLSKPTLEFLVATILGQKSRLTPRPINGLRQKVLSNFGLSGFVTRAYRLAFETIGNHALELVTGFG